MEGSGWSVRATPQRGDKPGRGKASWAAVALALVSCCVQGVNFVRTDLKPLLEAARQNQATLERIEQRLADHERRIAELERAGVTGRRGRETRGKGSEVRGWN